MQAYGTIPPRKGIFTGQKKIGTSKGTVRKPKQLMRPGKGMMNRKAS